MTAMEQDQIRECEARVITQEANKANSADAKKQRG